MSTQITDENGMVITTTRVERNSTKPVWPWLVAAAVLLTVILFFTGPHHTANDTQYNNSTTPMGLTPSQNPSPGPVAPSSGAGMATPGSADLGGTGR